MIFLLDFGLERFSFHFPRFSATVFSLACFPLVSLVFNTVFLHVPHFLCFCHWCCWFFCWFSCTLLTFLCFSWAFLAFPLVCPAYSSLFPIWSWVFPICHLSSFIFIRCSCCSLVFLLSNLAVAVTAAIASVVLLVLVAVVIVVVDLRHDGFQKKEREGGWGGGRSARLGRV